MWGKGVLIYCNLVTKQYPFWYPLKLKNTPLKKYIQITYFQKKILSVAG